MHKSKSGFTVIELLVALVIIAVLATILIGAYRGAQDRAKDTQTLNAVNQWTKVLQQYKVRNGTFPTVSSCLGKDYYYNIDESSATTGTGQCRQDNATTGILTNATFYSQISKYLTGNPTPAMTTSANSTTSWYRGAYYYIDGANSRIDFALTKSAGTCPATTSGLTLNTGANTTDGDLICTYILGQTAGY